MRGRDYRFPGTALLMIALEEGRDVIEGVSDEMVAGAGTITENSSKFSEIGVEFHPCSSM